MNSADNSYLEGHLFSNISGFTLIELMVVVAIIGILAFLAVPKFVNLRNQAEEAVTKGNLAAIRSAVSVYYSTNYFPVQELSGLVPGSIKRLPEGSVPSASAGLNSSWDTGCYIDFDSLETPSLRGDSDDSLDGGGPTDSGWAYHRGTQAVWIETRINDATGDPVHDW